MLKLPRVRWFAACAFALCITSMLMAEDLLPLEQLMDVAEKQQVSADAQAEFAKLYAEYGKSLEAYRSAVQVADAADPLWATANERQASIGRELADLKQKLETKEAAILKESPDAEADYMTWANTYRSLYNETGMIRALAADKATRPYFVWSNHFVLTSRPREQHPESIRSFLPESTKEMTPEDALQRMLKMADGREDDDRPKQLHALEEKLAAIDLPKKEIEELTRLNSMAMLYQGYSTIKKPQSVQAAEQKAIGIAEQISAVWPGWQDAYRQAQAVRNQMP